MNVADALGHSILDPLDLLTLWRVVELQSQFPRYSLDEYEAILQQVTTDNSQTWEKALYLTDNKQLDSVKANVNVYERNLYDPPIQARLDTSMVCRYCNLMGVYIRTAQTRSGDEPETTFYKCKHCQQTWRS